MAALRVFGSQMGFVWAFHGWAARWEALCFMARYWMSTPAERRTIRIRLHYHMTLLARDQALIVMGGQKRTPKKGKYYPTDKRTL